MCSGYWRECAISCLCCSLLMVPLPLLLRGLCVWSREEGLARSGGEWSGLSFGERLGGEADGRVLGEADACSRYPE